MQGIAEGISILALQLIVGTVIKGPLGRYDLSLLGSRGANG